MEHVALFAAGLALLAVGAPLLVFGAARLDRATGRSAFAVGAVAVCFGPCVAGLAFDLAAVLRQPEASRLAVGHIVGSVVASVGLVLGLASLVRPVQATAQTFRTAIPLAVGAVLLFWFVARDAPEQPVSQVGGGILVAAFVGVVAWLAWGARHESPETKAEFAGAVPERMPVWFAAVLAAAGIAALVYGGGLIAGKLGGAAGRLRVPWFVIGSTAGAFATALPAAVAAACAARRGRSDLVLGLVVGPVLCSALLLAGASAAVHPLNVEKRAILEMIPAAAVFALLLLPTVFNGLKVPRWEGALLLIAYAGFITWQVRVALRVAGN